MTPLIHIRTKDRTSGWLTMDMRDVEGVDTVIVIPLFGPDHNAGFDCWCRPYDDEGVIAHNACH